MEWSGSERFARALANERVTPLVCGLTFVDPSLLPGAVGAASPAATLAHACSSRGLDFAFVPSWGPWALDAVRALGSAGVAALWVVPGVWWPTLERLGVEQALRLSARDPEALAAALERLVPDALEAVAAGLAAGADALVVADDLAGDAGPFVAPAVLAAHVFPRLARIAGMGREAGLPAFLHCDGDARSLMSLVRGAGFSAIHGDCGGPERVEGVLVTARAESVVLIGGLPTPALTDPESGAHAGSQAAALAADGGLLLADDGGMTTPAQVEALFAALRAASPA